MVYRSLAKLIIFSIFLVLSNFVSAEIRIFNLKPYTELPNAGQGMELFIEVEGIQSEEEYYLISNIDQQSSMLKPATQEKTAAGVKLRFDLPAPILSLSYNLIVKKGLEIIAGSDTVSLARECFPILGNIKVDSTNANETDDSDILFRQAKNLEDDFANYSQIFLQLDYLKTVLKDN